MPEPDCRISEYVRVYSRGWYIKVEVVGIDRKIERDPSEVWSSHQIMYSHTVTSAPKHTMILYSFL